VSKGQSTERLATILETLSDVTVTLVADFFVGDGGGVAVATGLAKLGVTVLPVGVVGEDDNGQKVFQALHEHRVSTSGLSKLKKYATPLFSSGEELLHGEHPALLNLVEHARKFASASEAMYVCDCGIGAASPRVLNFIKSNRCMQEKMLAARSRHRLADFEQLTTAVASESEVAQAIGVEIGGDAKKLAVAGEGIVQEMKLESFLAVSGEKLLAFSGTHRSSLAAPAALSASEIDVLGAIFAAALSAGAEPVDAAQVAAQVTGFLKNRGAARKKIHHDELIALLAGPKATGRVR
jgi:bifunctional ADP-heptose synthase (sugar kinase/adenylyltransferase)